MPDSPTNNEDDRKNVRVAPINHDRLTRMKAQAILQGYELRSLDDALDLLLQVWDRASAKGYLISLVPAPRRQ
jgi:hypothetical protein